MQRLSRESPINIYDCLFGEQGPPAPFAQLAIGLIPLRSCALKLKIDELLYGLQKEQDEWGRADGAHRFQIG